MCRSVAGTEGYAAPTVAWFGAIGTGILLPYGNSSSGDGPLSDRIPVAARAALEAALRRQIAGHVLAGDEVETRVRIRRRDEMPAVAVKEHLQHREEPLQVRLLVDGEVEMPVVDRP